MSALKADKKNCNFSILFVFDIKSTDLNYIIVYILTVENIF